MERNGAKEKERRLASLRSGVLEKVSGGSPDPSRTGDADPWYDYFPGFDWASSSCQDAVRDAVNDGGQVGNGLDAWYGPACRWYGYYPW